MSQILKPKLKKGLTIFILFATVVSIKNQLFSSRDARDARDLNYGDANALPFSLVMSCDGHSYICRTCHKTMKNNCILCQAVFSKMGITFLPKESESISRLERVLVS